VLNIWDSAFINNVAGTIGGAINISLGTVSVTNSTFISNTSGSSNTSSSHGGGINSHNQSVLNVANSSFVGNASLGSFGLGGGIANDGYSTLTVANSTFDSNIASDFGGAIEDEGSLSIGESTLINNGAGVGGGGLNISSPGMTVYVTNT